MLKEFGAPLAVQEVELDAPKAGEVLVRLEACGVCLSSSWARARVRPRLLLPSARFELGHEPG
jgi:propanol-preferring alcohol dehydrogenase